MIAQVRPLRPEFAAESLRHLWGVVLPAAPPAPAVAGRERRRHHTGDPITRPVERATRLIPSTRLLTVLTREQTAHDDGVVLARVETLAVVTLPDAMAGACTQPIAEALAS